MSENFVLIEQDVFLNEHTSCENKSIPKTEP